MSMVEFESDFMSMAGIINYLDDVELKRGDFFKTYSIYDDGLFRQGIVRNYPYSLEGVAQFIKDNRLDFSLKKDAFYAGVVLSLLKRQVILSSPNEYNMSVSVAEVESLDPCLLDQAYQLSKSVIIAALYTFAKGMDVERINWYESFVKSKGDIVCRNGFIGLCEMILHGSLQKAMENITIEDVIAENHIYDGKLLTWLRSPSLVTTAIKALPYAPIFKCFPKEGLVSYLKFEKAGIAAQIASGRLSVYCNGTVNPLEVKDIPKNLRLADLQKVEAPYDAKVMMSAKVILDAIGFKYGRWYQAENARKKFRFKSNTFHRLVDALKSKSMLPDGGGGSGAGAGAGAGDAGGGVPAAAAAIPGAAEEKKES